MRSFTLSSLILLATIASSGAQLDAKAALAQLEEIAAQFNIPVDSQIDVPVKNEIDRNRPGQGFVWPPLYQPIQAEPEPQGPVPGGQGPRLRPGAQGAKPGAQGPRPGAQGAKPGAQGPKSGPRKECPGLCKMWFDGCNTRRCTATGSFIEDKKNKKKNKKETCEKRGVPSCEEAWFSCEDIVAQKEACKKEIPGEKKKAAKARCAQRFAGRTYCF